MKLKIRFHIDARGTEVMVGGKWVPADSSVLSNIEKILKEGLPAY